MLLLMCPTMKSITYKSEDISDDFEAVVSLKLGIAYFPVGRFRKPSAKSIMYGRNSKSFKLMCLLIPKHFWSVWTTLSSHWEIFWCTCPNLPNAKFSFRSIPNFFQDVKIFWDRFFFVPVQWSHDWPLEYKKFLKSINGFASYRCFSQQFLAENGKFCPFQLLSVVSNNYFFIFLKWEC